MHPGTQSLFTHFGNAWSELALNEQIHVVSYFFCSEQYSETKRQFHAKQIAGAFYVSFLYPSPQIKEAE